MILNFSCIGISYGDFSHTRVSICLKACNWYWWFLRFENYALRHYDSSSHKAFYSRHNRIYEDPRAQGRSSLFFQVYIQWIVEHLPHNSSLNEMLNELIMFSLLNCSHFLMFSIKGYTQIMFNVPDFEASSSMYGFSVVLT